MLKTKHVVLQTVLFITISMSFGQSKTKKIESLLDNYSRTINQIPDSAFYYLGEATRESKRINNSFLLSRCFYNTGYYYFLEKDFTKANYYFKKAIPIAKQSKNPKIIALSYNQLGLIEMEKGNFSTSLKEFLYALKISESNNLVLNQSYILNNLGTLYDVQGDTLKAIEYYKKNMEVALQHDFKENLLSSYNNIGLLLKKSNKLEALKYLKKAYQIAQEINDNNEQFNSLINLSFIYLTFNTEAYNSKSYQCLLQAKKLVEQSKNSSNLFFVNFNLANYYYKKKDFSKAIPLYEEALVVSNSGISEEQKLKLLKALADVYKNSKNYENAYLFNEKYYNKKDSLFNIDKNKTFTEIQTQYEVEKKNLKINLLTKEKIIEQNRKLQILYIALSIILVLVFITFFFKNRIKVQKIINEKEKELSNQEKELKRIQGLVEGQNQERNRIAKEIHDGVGGKLAGIRLDLTQTNSTIKNKNIETIITNFTQVFNEIRVISHNLSSNYIDQNTLYFLLKELQKEYNRRHEFLLDFTLFPEKKLLHLELELKHQLYRIIQELVSNISKHAQAKNALISITYDGDSLNLIAQDDGNGFKKQTHKGIGLKNIEERLHLLNGSITIDESIQSGTTIIIEIPNITIAS